MVSLSEQDTPHGLTLYDSAYFTFPEDRRRAKAQHDLLIELMREELGEHFPIYRGDRADLLGANLDLIPKCKQGNLKMRIKPMEPEQTILQLLSVSGGFGSLVNLAWRHAEAPFDDPAISWTTSLDAAREWARSRKKLHGNGTVIQAQGMILPSTLCLVSELKPNYGVSIPLLSRLRGSWPAKQCVGESEFITFGVFPAAGYKIIETV